MDKAISIVQSNLNNIVHYLDFEIPSLPHTYYYYGILYFSVAVYCFETYLDYRQYIKYQIKLRPKELTWVTDEEFIKAQEYGVDKSKFGFINSFSSMIKLFTLI